MPKSAAHIFFAIPELVLFLSAHIPKHDLTRCIRVCKEWSRQFEPVLWREFSINNRIASKINTVPAGVMIPARNLRHIQVLELSYVYYTQLRLLVQGLPYHLGDTVKDPSSVCTNLRRLDIDPDLDCLELMSRPLVTLLDYNPCLTHLDVQFEVFEIDGVSAAVSKLRHLQNLTVGSFTRATFKKPLLLLQSCLGLPELTELTFHRDLEMCWDYGDEIALKTELEAIIHEATIARFSKGPAAKRIKSLQLPFSGSRVQNPLPLLLLKSKLLDLDTCVIPWFGLGVSTLEIQWVVREHCPNLKHLECPDYMKQVQDAQAARAFIRGCTGLQSFTSSYFCDGLQTMLSELVLSHRTTLEVLELTDPEELFSRDLQSVLSQCKQLRRFWVLSSDYRSSMSGIAFRDISSSGWACSELKELGVTLNRCRSEGDAFGDLGEEEQQDDPRVWLAASTTKRVYQQIGRLGKLEVLEIDIDRTPRTKAKEHHYVWDLTLSKGYLNEMAGLKNLKSLRLRADFWSAMGQAEVEFMHGHWPLLNEIIYDSKNSNVSKFQNKRHWRWLRDKRPRLRFVGKVR